MPRRRRPENRGLPARWRLKHGAYYYRVPNELREFWDGKTEFRLGGTLTKAYSTWAKRLGETEPARTMAELLDRYAREVIPNKASKSQESNQLSIRRLRPVFGRMPISAVKPQHAYQYRDAITKRHGAASANRDLEVLSHSLSMAVEWGLAERNIVKGQVRKNRIPRRERYIEDWELEEALRIASPVLRAYISLKLLTALRRSDLLRLKTSDLKTDGIHVRTSKTGKQMIIEWTEELRDAVDESLAARPKDCVPWLFCTRQGKCYVSKSGSANGFDSLWQRFMARVIEKTAVEERFQEKDLRKKTASDMPLTHAQELLGHTTKSTTERHYRLRGTAVSPHSLRLRKKQAR